MGTKNLPDTQNTKLVAPPSATGQAAEEKQKQLYEAMKRVVERHAKVLARLAGM